MNRKKDVKLPLQDVRVLDLSRLIPGGLCTSILGDAGAEVIKIEEPRSGDYGREIYPTVGNMGSRFLILNRNKKSIALNLKSEKGRKLFLKLVESADVLLESFRPGTMTKLGIDYETIKDINPRLIYCSISSFGQDGPYRDLVAHDINILGMAGVLELSGSKQNPPTIPGLQIADSVSGANAAISILLSLIDRRSKNSGRCIDISMFDSVFAWLFDPVSYMFAGISLPERGAGRLWGGLPNYNIYKTKDGKYITVGALELKFKNKLLRKLGIEDFTENNSVTTSKPQASDVELNSKLREVFSKKTRDEWSDEFSEMNICVYPVNSLDEAILQPVLTSREMVVELEDSLLGKYKQLGTPFKSTSILTKPDRLTAPQLGEHSREIIEELGYTEDEIRAFIESDVVRIFER